MISKRELQMAASLTQEQVAVMIVAIEQFSDLMGDSSGVIGLHLNGDVAEWDWLEGEWLSAFAAAREPIKALHDARISELERSKSRAWGELQAERGAA